MAKKGKLRHIRIEKAGNGYSVHAHHDMASPGGTGPMGDAEPMVFQKKKHVLDHVSSLMNDDDSDDNAQPMVPASHPVKALQRKGY